MKTHIQIELLNYPKLETEGIKWIERKYIPIDSIYISPNENKVRRKISDEQVNALEYLLLNKLDHNYPVPIVRKLDIPKIVNGKRYSYELVIGNHRQLALLRLLKKCLVDHWVYDVYKFAENGLDDYFSVMDSQFAENDAHLPAIPNGKNDVIEGLANIVAKGHIENNEKAIRDYVNMRFTTMHGSTRSSIVNAVVARNGSYKDVSVYNFDQVKDILDNGSNYEPGQEKYTTGGEYDHNRKECGWTVLEGYEPDIFTNCLKKFKREGRESYILGHTKTPSKSRDLNERRLTIKDTLEEFEQAVLLAVKFYEENGRFPWRLEGFLAQNNKDEENGFLSVEEVVSSVNQLLKKAS